MKKYIYILFPFLEWIKELKNTKTLKKDIISGLTVALVLIPQSMAYAGLAGLPLEVGLYTAFIPVMIAGLFGSARQMSTGPVTIMSLMTATALAPIAVSGTEGYIVYASLLALFIGIFYLLLSFLRLGIIVEFLSHPVIIGFTNAVALITIISQLPKLLGFSIISGGNMIGNIQNIYQGIIDSIHIPTLIFGVGAIVAMIGFKKIAPKLPRVLIILSISILTSYYFGFHQIYGGVIVTDIPSNLPNFILPFFNEYTNNLNFENISKLLSYAVIIALIGFTESISVAKIIGYKTKQRLAPNRELYGQGLANIASSLFGGYGVAGSFSKTAVNLRAGAKTGFSSVVTGITVGLTILYLTPLLYHLPLTTLAAVIIVAVFDLIKINPIIKAWKIEKHDGIIAIITFSLTLMFTPSIEKGLLIGLILSLSLYIFRTMRPKLITVGMYKDGELRDIELFGLKESKTVSVLRFDGILYFANSTHFETEILEFVEDKKKLKYIIFDFEWMNDIDSTGLEMLENLIIQLSKDEYKVFISSIRTKVADKLVRVGFFEEFGEKNIFKNIEETIEYIEKKHGKKADLNHLQEYVPDKKKFPELDIDVIKKIDNI